MIPFWKKTGKHSKPQSAQKRRQERKACCAPDCPAVHPHAADV